MGNTLIFLFAALFSVVYSAEIPDVTIIYKVHNTSGGNADQVPIDVEIHSQTNSLGKVFLFNNRILSPASPGALPSFACVHSSESCPWWRTGSWTSTSLSSELIKTLSLSPPEANFVCEIDNGGCQVTCTNTVLGPVCSCPYAFSLNADNKTCSAVSSCHQIITRDHGTFHSPNYASNYPDNTNCSWLILTSKEKKISLSIPRFLTEDSHDVLTVYDGAHQHLGRWSGSHSYISTQSTRNVMLVTFKTDYSVTKTGFEASYTAVSGSTQPAALMTSTTGNIKASVNVPKNHLCLSIIHTIPTSSSLNVTVYESSRISNLTLSQRTQVDEWFISRFILPHYLDSIGKNVELTLHLEGRNSKIFSVTECSSHETDVYVLPSFVRARNAFPKQTPIKADSTKKCYNGGSFEQSAGVCICPVGFTGDACQEACGANRYGQNCTGLCSGFEMGCRGMIFCNTYKSCMCATGFTGIDCTDECSPGTYGSNCANTCGQCGEQNCNTYTGECTDECKEGYYPPFCQNRYLTLNKAPNITEKSWYYTTISINFTDVQGKGSPLLYEVQYKGPEDEEWIKTSKQEIDSRSVVVANVTDLKPGTLYVLRVPITCQDGNNYQGPGIPTLKFETLCEVPDSNNYQMESKNITPSGFVIEWKYSVNSDKWCSIKTFEVILQERWRKYPKIVSSDHVNLRFSDLLPGHEYTVYMRAITNKGPVPYSSPFIIATANKAPEKVRHLAVDSRNPQDVRISWRPPLFTGGKIKGYRIIYQCIKYLTCQETCKNSNGSQETTETSASVLNLIPNVQYKIKVAAYSESQGRHAEVFTTTKATSPEVAPIASEQPIVSKTNTTVKVQWQSPPCPGRNGHLMGYYFTLSSRSEDNLTVIQNGTTKNVQTNFSGLSPRTQYEVQVYAFTSHGWNAEYKLIIPFLSSATVPEAVQDLQVYKKGRRMLGIRWKKPTKTYGDLKTFTITYHQKGTEDKFNETILPIPCSGWPHLFCHTINTNLRSDKQYVVVVKARNVEIDEDGVSSEVNAITRESAPDAPSSLRIMRSTSTSFEMQWGLPEMFNGEIRSFLVNVEHVDTYNDSECCEYFPVQELPFREEIPSYNLEVSGLLPASTYVVSVTAKTTTLGPSINATYYTAPLPPSDIQPPRVLSAAEDGHSYHIQIQPIKTDNINSTYLLLVLPREQKLSSVMWKKELSEKLTDAVNSSYYIVSEISSHDLVDGKEMTIGTGSAARNGTLGKLEDPILSPGMYRVGLALVQSYGEAVSVGLAISNLFEVHILPGPAK